MVWAVWNRASFSLLLYVLDAGPDGYTENDISPFLGENAVIIDYTIGEILTLNFDGSLDGSRRDVDGLIQITITTITTMYRRVARMLQRAGLLMRKSELREEW